MKWFISAAVAAIISLSVGTASADTVKVGLIADFTGAFATWGSQFQQAIEAYQAIHGKSVKGPDGKLHEIEYVYRDSASGGPDKAKQLAEELVLREHVKFLAGFDLSPQAMAVADVANQAKVPVVIMNAATASITRGSPYFVRVSMTIPQFTVPLAQWAYKRHPEGLHHRQRLRSGLRRRKLLYKDVQGIGGRDRRERPDATAGNGLRLVHGKGTAG